MSAGSVDPDRVMAVLDWATSVGAVRLRAGQAVGLARAAMRRRICRLSVVHGITSPATPGPGGRAATTAHARALHRIFDALDEPVFVCTPAGGRVLDLNRAAEEALDWPAAAVRRRTLWSLLRHRDGRDAQSLARPIIDGLVETLTIPVTLYGRGSRQARDLRLERLETAGEDPRLVAIARTSADNPVASDQLLRLAQVEHARAAELNAVIRAMGEGVIVCGPDGRITLTNPAGSKMLRSVAGRTYADVLALLRDPDGLAPPLGTTGGPVALPTRDDPETWIEITTYPVGGASDASDGDGTIVVLRDVTDSRQREAIRETFIGVLSHELRTPVTTIYGGAKILGRPNSDLDELTRRAIFEDIADEAERLQRLVEDVVALNRFGEDGGQLGHEPVLLQRVVPGVVQSEQARWPNARFQLHVQPGLPTVVADPTYVEQVVRNLLSNAAKYGGPKSIVHVAVDRGEDEILVRILDDGPGIEPGEASKLFELFYRSPTTSSVASGAGIGLFVCARLMQAMDGRIWARPRETGGAEFGFALREMHES